MPHKFTDQNTMPKSATTATKLTDHDVPPLIAPDRDMEMVESRLTEVSAKMNKFTDFIDARIEELASRPDIRSGMTHHQVLRLVSKIVSESM